MNQRQRLEEVVTRLTPEQYVRLLSFAESLAAELDAESVAALPQRFPEPLRLRLRELTTRSEAETLNDAERAEYIVLAEQLERADAGRLAAAARLSERRNIPLAQALAELNAGASPRG